MRTSDSRHLLPINTMLFSGELTPSPKRKSVYLANQTLANLQDAQDETITALPQHPGSHPGFDEIEEEQVLVKESFWGKLAAKSRRWMCFGTQQKKKEMMKSPGEMEKVKLVIGEPTEFRHVGTAAPVARRRSQGVQLVDGDSDWEDLE
ncbi:hypothetical protein PtrSN002B_002763 [Pyrenophora tritici-repentis]|uniref:Uncharacterized protein n=2 Tax=Pyrenophora tritici-repentis TaxID=45151 RepID=A0A2W1FAQ2_9PLEO|nr:uncharacterized protein PTRG_03867 [Pyrenophora tritici-repentis Pt-1C-BFP]KAA8620074.1 hypothetical protein PtrV1_07168 [Pyrenophora tritici-repentis]EDU46705.1 predicted protein [Pyrenophora tritici-repentis Pt-1C-BFP]KAF7448225.1 hypothetical protein A1F99_075890 [Pyrenophora tritici-repentis]KAF7571938.1 hypothetical protein PtrM4_094380 [Pyrenophora tritici-repentis]KAG9384872.1 hypothetical protein A1F94_004419 [Pyrenophora tritici-repentis]